MDIKDNNQSYNAFIEKTKKQAKKLLKISKESNSEIKILNLSQAQELLAQINGFPDWHALETKIKRSVFNSNDLIESYQTNNKYEKIIHGTYVLESHHFYAESVFSFNLNENYKYICFYDIPKITNQDNFEEIEYLFNIISSFSKDNKIELFFINDEINQGENTYLISQYSNIFNLSEKEFKSLFAIDYSLFLKSGSFHTNIFLSVSSNDYEECIKINNFLADNAFSNKNFIIDDLALLYNNNLSKEYVKYNFKLSDTFYANKSLNFLNFKKPNINVKKIIFALAMLYNHNFKWFTSFDLSSDEFNCYYENDSDIYFKGITSVLNSGEYNNHDVNFDFCNKEIKTKEEFGIPFLDLESNQINQYNHQNNEIYRHSNIFIAGKSGTGKTTLLNSLNLQYLFDFKEKLPYFGSISICKNNFLEFYKSFINQKFHNDVAILNIDKNTIINPFDLNIGCDSLTEQQMFRAIEILKMFLSEENKFIEHENDLNTIYRELINIAITETSKNKNPKLIITQLFDSGLLKEHNILALLKKHKIKTNTSFFNAADQLYNLGYLEEAQILYFYASPTLSDVINALHSFSEINSNIKNYLFSSFSNLISNDSIYNKVTNISIFNKKVVDFNLESLHQDNINNYLEKNKIFSFKYLLCFNKLATHFEYNYFTDKKFKKVRLSFDEFNFDHNKLFNKHLRNSFIVQLRDSRKFNFESIFSSQSVELLIDKQFSICISEIFLLSYFDDNQTSRTDLKEFFGNNLDPINNKIKKIKNTKSFLYASFPVYPPKNHKRVKNVVLKLNSFLLKNI